nr:MAG TPA: hypothetical protein [Caudoviricetes sp.]
MCLYYEEKSTRQSLQCSHETPCCRSSCLP